MLVCERRVNNELIPKYANIRGTMYPLGFAALTVTAAQLIPSIPASARIAIIMPEGNGIRWRDDGTAPTATVGMPLGAGGALTYDGDLTKLQLVSQTGSATVNICFYS